MKTESIWNNSEDLKGAVSEWADRIGVEVREVHLRDMRRKWASISTNGRLTLNTDLLDLPEDVGRICHRPRISPSPRPKSREGVQKFHVRLPTRLGGTAASPTGLAGDLEIDFHPSTLPPFRFTYCYATNKHRSNPPLFRSKVSTQIKIFPS